MDIDSDVNIGFYWYAPSPNLWLRCRLVNKAFNLVTLESLCAGGGVRAGMRVSGRARRVGDAFIVDGDKT
jgi:hypothetical protein